METNKMVSQIIQAVENLQVFSIEDLLRELLFIPDCIRKWKCIDQVLESPEVKQVLGVFYYQK
jgi:hypothetical protein